MASPPVLCRTTLRIVTWNVWFSDHQADLRMAALFSELLEQAPDVACLQEARATRCAPHAVHHTLRTTRCAPHAACHRMPATRHHCHATTATLPPFGGARAMAQCAHTLAAPRRLSAERSLPEIVVDDGYRLDCPLGVKLTGRVLTVLADRQRLLRLWVP